MIVEAREFTGSAIEIAQKQAAIEVRARLNRGEKRLPVPQTSAEALIIGELREEIAKLQRALARAQSSLRFVADREQHHRDTERKMELLELDLADARARVLSQAEMLKAPIDEDGEATTDHRRSVPEIVAEVLREYPGVTWEDIKGVRRTHNLIAPRHACMMAVYEERKDLSLPRIGKIFHRDHTTILSSVQKTEAQRGEA
jgi:hypothetical protein